MRLEDLVYSSFAGREGETFSLRHEPETAIDLTLAEVSALGPSAPESGDEPLAFSVIFDGPRDYFLPQGTYPLQHAELGECTLFLVPVGQGESAYHYQAIFNRLPKKAAPTA